MQVTQQYISGGGSSLKSAAGKGVAAAVGVTRLMQQCTQMLRDRMWSEGGRCERDGLHVMVPMQQRMQDAELW